MQHETQNHHEGHEGEAHHAHHAGSDASAPLHHEEKEHKLKKKTLSTQASILLGAALIAVAVIAHGFLAQGGSSSGGNLAYLDSFTGKAPNTDLYVEGKKDNKLYFVEYSDSECPFCIAFHHTVTQLREKYAGKITYVYRYFPLTQIHPDALPEAIKMSCVGKLKGQEAYYDFMTKVFDYKIEKQASKISDEFVASYLKDASIDQGEFSKCVSDPATTALVQESLQDGSGAGVNGTPTSFLLMKDGDDFKVIKRFEGASQLSFITPIIEKALKQK